MAEHDPSIRGTDRPRTFGKLAPFQAENLPANQSGKAEPSKERKRQNHRQQAAGRGIEAAQRKQQAALNARQRCAEVGADDNNQQQIGKREHDVHDPHEHEVDAAAVVPGDQTRRDAQKQHEHDRDQGDAERNPRPIDQTAENVTPSASVPSRWARLGT